MWDVIVSFPDHCLSFYFTDTFEDNSPTLVFLDRSSTKFNTV